MSQDELEIGIEKRWIMCDSLVQQIDGLQQIRFPRSARLSCQKKIFGASVEIEGGEVGGWWLLDCQPFSG